MGELHDLDWDVMCFSETIAKDDLIDLDGGHRLLTCLFGDKFAGVGLLVHRKWRQKILRYHRISGRVCAVDIKMRNEDFCVPNYLGIYSLWRS